MEQQGGKIHVQMTATGTIKYPDGTETEITFKSKSKSVDEILALKEKKEDGNNPKHGG